MHTKQDCGPCRLFIGSLKVTSAMIMTHRSGFRKYSRFCRHLNWCTGACRMRVHITGTLNAGHLQLNAGHLQLNAGHLQVNGDGTSRLRMKHSQSVISAVRVLK